MCTMQLSNFKLNTRKGGSIHKKHSTDEGLSPETSEHFYTLALSATFLTYIIS